MKSLQISYQTENGDVMTIMYNSVEEFIHIIENYYPSASMLNGVNVIASFHGKEQYVKTFDTVRELLDYCKKITNNKRNVSEEMQKVLDEIDKRESIRNKYSYLADSRRMEEK